MTRSHRARRRAAAAGLVLALLGTTACAGLFGRWGTAPNGLARDDDALRRELAEGRYAAALDRVGPDADDAPEDELLRLLYEGVVSHYAGRFRESTAALDRATVLAEDRYTKSVSRGALALVSSDLALEYLPGRTERLLVHYYAALNQIQLGDLEGAEVEARRLSRLLERYADDGWACAGGELCEALRYFSGTIFEAAGSRNDAAVAYRHSPRPASRFAFAHDTADAAAPRPPADSMGDVVLLVERGFVAHRIEESLMVVLGAGEVAAFRSGDDDQRAALSATIASRLLREMGEPVALEAAGDRGRLRADADRDDDDCDANAGSRGGRRTNGDRSGSSDACEEDDRYEANPYLLRVAWPSYRTDRRPAPRAVVRATGRTEAATAFLTSISEPVVQDFGDSRLAVLTRAVARAAAKFATTRAIEREAAERDETLGRVIGLLANLGGALTERADTRSWHMLPDAIGIVRLRMPAGSRELSVELTGDGGSRRVEVGPVEVRPGGISFATVRAWR